MPNHRRSWCQEYVGKETGTPFSEGTSHQKLAIKTIFSFPFKLTAIKSAIRKYLSQQQIMMLRKKRIIIIIQDEWNSYVVQSCCADRAW